MVLFRIMLAFGAPLTGSSSDRKSATLAKPDFRTAFQNIVVKQGNKGLAAI
jgi:hypothetical protein